MIGIGLWVIAGVLFLAHQIRIYKLEEMCEWQKIRIRELEEKCAYDSLTGLLKSDSFEECVLERMEKMSHKNRSDDICHTAGPVAIVFIDLDHFKNANDTLGHDAGNKILQIFSEIIRGADLVARNGGDEFLMALFGVNKEEASIRLVEMRKQFEAASKVAFPTLKIPTTFSFGIKVVSAEGMTLAILKKVVRDADGEMYQHKRARASK